MPGCLGCIARVALLVAALAAVAISISTGYGWLVLAGIVLAVVIRTLALFYRGAGSLDE